MFFRHGGLLCRNSVHRDPAQQGTHVASPGFPSYTNADRMSGFWRRLPLVLLIVANAALAVYFAGFDLNGMLHTDGTDEGWLGMIVIAAGFATAVAALPALWWFILADKLSPKGYAVRLIVAAVIASLPWAVATRVLWLSK